MAVAGMAASEERTVGIVVEHRRIDHPWAEARWQPVAVGPPQFALAPWSILEEGEGWTRYYAGPAVLSLFPSETENYKHNLDAGRPTLYVVLRRSDDPPGMSLLLATVDPGEIDAHSDAGDDLIEALPLPVPLALWVYGFVARHHVERPFHKRKRDRADTEVLARGGIPSPAPGEGQGGGTGKNQALDPRETLTRPLRGHPLPGRERVEGRRP